MKKDSKGYPLSSTKSLCMVKAVIIEK